MRLKIIAVFSLIVVVLSGLIYALSVASVGKVSNADQAPRALQGAVIQLEVEGLATERWLGAKVTDPSVREPFGAGTPTARGEQATGVANKIREAAASAPELLGIQPALIALVDTNGVVLGRNNSTLMRGEDLTKAYPSLKTALEAGTPISDVWVSKQRNEQLLASFVPVRGDDGKVVGGVVFGSSLNDERLTNASDKTSGHALLLAVKGDKGLEVVAKSSKADAAMLAVAQKPPASEVMEKALTAVEDRDIPGFPAGFTAKGRALEGYGDGKRAVVVAVVAPAASGTSLSLLWPALGAAVLGIVLVVLSGFLLDAYISRPVAEIEDGLLAIMNGQTNRRFEIVHAELGGLVFRLNSLLNQLFGVAEDDTDEEGRPSTAPTGKAFQEALAVDESMAMSGTATPESQALRAEPDDQYYGRIFSEYVAAKRSVGDPTDHITKDEFIGRIMASEREMGQKHGKPVRYKVEVKGKEVMLIAIPLV
jgi:hypothetical protein